MTQPSELYYLDAFPEECEALANSYQAGELTDEVFWAKLDEIKKQKNGRELQKRRIQERAQLLADTPVRGDETCG